MSKKKLETQVRHLLRHLRNPEDLRYNPVASRCSSHGNSLWEYVHEAALNLPEPSRTIIVRCDLSEELHKVVAASLGVSERHFYRLRRLAVAQLADLLERAELPKWQQAIEIDPADLHLIYAVAQKNAGNVDAAIAIIEDAQRSRPNSERLIRNFCWLADVCCESGRTHVARIYINSARAAFVRTRTTIASAEAIDSELDAAELKLAWSLGDLRTVRNRIGQVVRSLRYATLVTPSSQTADALASTLLLMSQLRTDEGAFGEALLNASEAMTLFSDAGVARSALRLQCANVVATLRTFVGGEVQRAVQELSGALAEAKAQGIPDVAANIAINLASIYGRCKNFDSALRFGYAALSLGRLTSPVETIARMTLDVATVHLLRKETRPAQDLLSEARRRVPMNPYFLGIANLLEADLYLVERDYHKACDKARSSAIVMQELGLSRFLGSALRIEAEAMEGLGKHEAAERTIGESIRVLQSSGHAFTLAQAYRCSARISQLRAHNQLARDLLTGLSL